MSDAPSITAADIMQKDVVVVPMNDQLRYAIQLMIDHHITGMPVVDHEKRCCGVVSANIALAYGRELSNEADNQVQFFDPGLEKWCAVSAESFDSEAYESVKVSEVMEPDVINVAPETPVAEVAQTMFKDRIHRVFVLDNERHVQGVISSFDFVRLAAGG